MADTSPATIYEWYRTHSSGWTWENDDPEQGSLVDAGRMRLRNGWYGLYVSAVPNPQMGGSVILHAHGSWKPISLHRTKQTLDESVVPNFWTAHYVDPSSVERVSYFRSGSGHSYTGDFESCRSMKTYMAPVENASQPTHHSPVAGTIQSLIPDGSVGGTQVHIVPDGQPAFRIVAFHVDTKDSLSIGQSVSAGQALGTYKWGDGRHTNGDVSLRVRVKNGFSYVPIWWAMSEDVWSDWKQRGLSSRNSAVIPKSKRDQNRLSCADDSDSFIGENEPGVDEDDWVFLNA